MMKDVNTVDEVMAELRALGTEKARVMYVKHGTPADKVLGVSFADLKTVAKGIRGRQELALELYRQPFMESKYLAGMVAKGAQMSRDDVEAWALGIDGIGTTAEWTVPWVAVEHPAGRELALEWIDSGDAQIACAGWCTYSGLVTTLPDERLDLGEIRGLLERVVSRIEAAPNRVRYCMNGFVIAVGIYVAPLAAETRSAAERMGVVTVDVGKTACQVPVATERIAAPRAKRKTIRC